MNRRMIFLLLASLITMLSRQMAQAAPGTTYVADPWNIVPAGQLGRGKVNAMAWSPDGKLMALAGSLGIWLYHTDNFNAIPRLLVGHAKSVVTLAFSPDGKQLV